MQITYVPDPTKADGSPVVAEVISLGTTLVAFPDAQPVVVMGGTIQTTISFSGSVSTDIGSVQIIDASHNSAVVPTAGSAKTPSTTALVVQHVDDTGTPLREGTQVSMLAALAMANSIATASLNNHGTDATSALQATGNSLLSAILNAQGTQSTATLATIASSQATASNQVAGLATETAILNEMGTLATSANQVSGNSTLSGIATTLSAQSTAANQAAQTASTTAILNEMGTLATSANQVTSNAYLLEIATAAGVSATAANQVTGNSSLSTIVSELATVATTGNQVAQTSALTVIMNGQGTLSPTPLVNPLVVVMNGQGTLATSANQAVGNALATITMNGQGTLATSANQATGNVIASVVMNDMGTVATSANQVAGNTLATAIMNNQGTVATSANQVTSNAYLLTLATASASQATAANQQALLTQQAAIIRTFGATGTLPNSTSSVSMGLDPSAVSTDAFGRLRVSTPDYRFDGQLTYNVPGDLWDTAWNSTGTVTYDPTNRLANITCAANGTSVLQGHKYAPYTPGRSQLAIMSFVAGSAPPFNTARRIGYYDGTNGVYLEQTPTTVNLVLASSTTNGNETAAQTTWNIDKMDGSGPSGIQLDLSKAQIMAISFQALYSGRVVVGFDINGILWPVHQFTHANKISVPYIANASLPVHYEARSTGSNTVSLSAICASVMSEGGGSLSEIPARTFAAARSSAVGVTTRVPIVSIRPNQSFNGVANTSMILPSTFGAYSSAQAIIVELVRNGVLTGASWSNVDSNSVAQSDTSATAISGGSTVFTTFIGSGGAGAASIPLSANLLDRLIISYSQLTSTADTLTLVATSTGGSTNVLASLVWKEIR